MMSALHLCSELRKRAEKPQADVCRRLKSNGRDCHEKQTVCCVAPKKNDSLKKLTITIKYHTRASSSAVRL